MSKKPQRVESDLSRDWIREMRDMAKPEGADRAVEHAGKALAAFSEDDFRESIFHAEKAKTQASRSPKIRELLGLSYYQMGRWQEAARELLTFRRLSGSFEEHHVIADCYRALEKPDRALEICAEVPPGTLSAELQAELAIVAAGALADKGMIERALSHIATADVEPRTIEPYHLRIWYMRADLFEKAGDTQRARSLWDRIYAEDPDYFDVSDRVK